MAYAVHDDFSILAVGETAEQALERARDGVGDPEATFAVALISDGFAHRIARDGWNPNFRSFEVRDGWLYETTGR